MAHKSEVFEKLEGWIAWAQPLFGKIYQVRSDNGGEFVNEKIRGLFQRNGTIAELTAPYNPEQNGVSERGLGIMFDGVRAMITDAHLPKHTFPEIFRTMIYLSNLCPTSVNPEDMTPYQRFFNIAPILIHLRILGCLCYKTVPREPLLKKLNNRADLYYLLGYGPAAN